MDKLSDEEETMHFPHIRFILFILCIVPLFYDSVLAGICSILAVITMLPIFWNLLDKHDKMPVIIEYLSSWFFFIIAVVIAYKVNG